MKRIIALLIILTFASLAFEASAQQQIVEKGQIHKYSVIQPSTSKFSWTIFKEDGITLADPTKYKIFRKRPTSPSTAISENFSTPSQSKEGTKLNVNNSVYVYWLGDENQKFIVSAREYDFYTECSDKVYNTINQNVIIKPLIDMFRANISWDGKEDCNTITSTEEIPASATTLKQTNYYSTFSFTVKVLNSDKTVANKWYYKYKYIVADNIFTPPTDAQWLTATVFDSNKIDGNIDSDMITLDKIEIAKGNGQALVWVKLVLVKDIKNTSALVNPLTNLIAHAVVNKAPKDQVIKLVD